MLLAVVPLADARGAIAPFVQRLRHRDLGRFHRLPIVRDAMASRAQRPAPREQSRARRGAKRVHIEPIKPHALRAQLVDVRRLQMRVAVDGEVAVALVIGDDEEDVGFGLGGVKC